MMVGDHWWPFFNHVTVIVYSMILFFDYSTIVIILEVTDP